MRIKDKAETTLLLFLKTELAAFFSHWQRPRNFVSVAENTQHYFQP